MKVTLMGTGCGPVPELQADYAVGAARLLEGYSGRKDAATKAEDILRLILASSCKNCAVLYSGDTGFYSGAQTLLPLLRERGIEAEVVPGLSSVQVLAARLGRPWQDWTLHSAHGTACDPVAAVCRGKPAFFLTGGPSGPAALCQELVQTGLGELVVTVGENLGFQGEAVSQMTVSQCAERTFAPLNVLLVESAPVLPRRTPGIPDGEFVRGEGVPMTKQEVRAVILSKLAVGPKDICWDVGAGTGSVSVELALQARAVWAVERDSAACALIRANREKFGAWKLRPVEGTAPQVLEDIPAPDVVFVGGSSGKLSEILVAAGRKNPGVRVCVSAISLETLYAAMGSLRDPEVTQIAVSRTRPAGPLHLLTAQNPVFLITGVLS
ncbi:precorrin-6Y C5,15-methyltransferase (decarboxylating) subunit CbiT [Oscillospiraceae bacterium 44-5]